MKDSKSAKVGDRVRVLGEGLEGGQEGVVIEVKAGPVFPVVIKTDGVEYFHEVPLSLDYSEFEIVD